MKTSPPAAAAPDDDLLKLEMHVARRADILAQGRSGDRDADLAHWLQAEREVLGRQLPAACGQV